MNSSLFSGLNFRVPGLPLKEAADASWVSPSNIALVKYWGKKQGQLPMNPSLSMTLCQASTTTEVRAAFSGARGAVLSVNGDPDHPFKPKLVGLLDWLATEIPVLANFSFVVRTSGNFPHSTGIASSASGLSAFTLCMLTIAQEILETEITGNEMAMMASFASRMGSGSACRSIYGGFALWGESSLVNGSSDLFAIPVNEKVHPSMRNLQDAILVVSTTPKKLSSSSGHALMNVHPYAPARIIQSRQNLSETLEALESADTERLAAVVENEALSLHALIMSSPGGYVLMEPGTVYLIERIRKARSQGLPVFFTLDAGPNVHLLYPAAAVTQVEKFIRDELTAFCEKGQVIYDRCGTGPGPVVT